MKDEIKIEKGIAIPIGHQVGISATMGKLEIGDSFLVNESSRPGLFTAASKSGIRILTRRDGGGKVRVWRIA